MTNNNLKAQREEAEKGVIEEALGKFNGNRRATAAFLQISLRALQTKIKKYSLPGNWRK